MGRLYFLDISGRILSCSTASTDTKTLVDNLKDHPDGIAVDHARKHIWWTNMGSTINDDGTCYKHDGSIQRCDVDGANLKTIIPEGVTRTPKQCIVAPKSQQLYWCDREGMRVMRSNLDGTGVETLIVSGTSDEDMRNPENWCVGVSVDERNGHLYWTQKGPPKAGKGRIFRAGLQLLPGEKAETRTDIQVLFDNLPEPIDLEFDEEHNRLYWTDRGAPPEGNTVNGAFMVAGAGSSFEKSILVKNLHEGIGISLGLANKRMFFGDLQGSIYEADLDGKNEKVILRNMGHTTGIAYVDTA